MRENMLLLHVGVTGWRLFYVAPESLGSFTSSRSFLFSFGSLLFLGFVVRLLFRLRWSLSERLLPYMGFTKLPTAENAPRPGCLVKPMPSISFSWRVS